MIPVDADNLDQMIEEFSSDELLNLSEDLLKIAIELTMQDDLELPEIESVARSNDLLAIIPKIVASRLNKAELYSQKFTALDQEDLIFAGYTVDELRSVKKLLEDVLSLIERRSRDDLNDIYREVFDELKDNFEINPGFYRKALCKVNEAYRIQSRHLMTTAIEVYKKVTFYNFDHFLHQNPGELEEYQEHLTNAIELIESSEIQEKYGEQLHELRKTLILVLEALNTQAIGTGFSTKKISYIHDILYHIRQRPEEYIFEVLQRFSQLGKDRQRVEDYMPPEEIAVRYSSRYIKHNRVLLSFITNPIDVNQDILLESANTVLKNLSDALNVKLRFIRTGRLCEQILDDYTTTDHLFSPYSQDVLKRYYDQLSYSLAILEKYTINSDYLENLQEQCYRISIKLVESSEEEHLEELISLVQRYQIYAARRLFALRISTLCIFISSRSARQLSHIATEKILTVCRDVIQYKYDFLKPSSIYLESRFDLEYYREPVLSKIDAALHILQTGEMEEAPETVSEEAVPEISTQLEEEDESRLKPFFSQLVIDCLALKVQELDTLPTIVPADQPLTREEIVSRIDAAKDHIQYFLKQLNEESVLFLESYQPQDDVSA